MRPAPRQQCSTLQACVHSPCRGGAECGGHTPGRHRFGRCLRVVSRRVRQVFCLHPSFDSTPRFCRKALTVLPPCSNHTRQSSHPVMHRYRGGGAMLVNWFKPRFSCSDLFFENPPTNAPPPPDRHHRQPSGLQSAPARLPQMNLSCIQTGNREVGPVGPDPEQIHPASQPVRAFRAEGNC